MSQLTATLRLSETQKARLWEAHVTRQALEELGVLISPEVLEGEPRPAMEEDLKATLPHLTKEELFALMALAERLKPIEARDSDMVT